MRRGVSSQIPLLCHPSAPGVQSTDVKVDRTDRFVLFKLQFVAVANERNWRKSRERQLRLLLLLVPDTKVCDRLSVFSDGTRGTIFFLHIPGFQPNGEEDECRRSALPSGKRGRSSLTLWQTASKSWVSCRLLKGRTSTWTTSEPHCTRPGNWKKGKSRCQVA